MLDTFVRDIRFAFRWLRRSPGFTLVAVASFGIGIGFNTALYTIVDAVLFKPLPVRAPNRLVDVYTNSSDGDTYATSSYPDFLDLKAENSVFEDMAAHSVMFAAINLTESSRLVLGEIVTGNYFRMLGVRAAFGRTLLPEDDVPGAERVVMISDRYWRREFGSDPTVLGRSIRLRGQTYTVVGVAPRSFTGMVPLLSPEIWVPISHVAEIEPVGAQDFVPSPTGTNRLERRGQRWAFVKGRLKAGASVEQARANLDLIMRRLADAYPQTNKDRKIAVKATSDVRIHPDVDRLLVPLGAGLMLLVGLVLLIACANVASMLLARAAARQREIGIRLAIGASHGRLMRQLITESLVLALAGGAGGTALAWWLTTAATTVELPLPFPVSLDLRIDIRVLAFTLAVTVLAGLIAGLAPALRAARLSLARDLCGEASAVQVAGRRWTLRDGLVALQMAVTLLLLVVAGLLTRSLIAAQKADPGFRTEGLAILSAYLGFQRHEKDDLSSQFWSRTLERARVLPGVESAALATHLPFSLNFSYATIYIPARHQPGDAGVAIQNTRVSPEYFKTLGVPILEGRGFTQADTPQTPGVAVINETMARRFWPGESAIGKTFHLRGPEGPRFEIVGVAADHRLRTVGELPQPYIHFAQTQRPDAYQVLVARTRGDAGTLLNRLRRELLAMEPHLTFIDNQTMETQVLGTLFPIRAGAWIVSVVGFVALLLASIGLYGVIAYSVARRTREIGIRMAMGARPASVLGLVLRQGLRLAAAGLAAGCALAAIATRVLAGMLYGVSLADPAAWSVAVAVLLAVSVIANLVPARRAARVDPSLALRAE